MKKLSNIIIGFFQATSVVLYCILAVLIMNNLSRVAPYDQTITGLFILIFFIISALITASSVFAYPIYLYLEKKQTKKAIIIVIITTLWLIGFFLGILTIFILSPKAEVIPI